MRTLVFIAVTGALIACACALVGCGGGPTQPPPGDAMLALGTAATDGSGFVALGGDATLVPGAQGGFHIWLKYRVAGMAPATVKVHRESRRVSDDALVLLADGTQDVGAPGDDGWWELPTAMPSFMCPTPIGINVIDERIVFEVTLTTMDGAPLAKSSAEATVHCPDGTQAAFCAKICSG
ncbi:MAG TPA: hypothetical protein VHB97_21840 [Polyangia bacterium]|nr:hypothetical protein [Polyangia bacterium]